MSIVYWRGKEEIKSCIYTEKIEIKYVQSVNKS